MATAQVGKLLVQIGADARELHSAFRGVDASFTRFAKNVSAIAVAAIASGFAIATAAVKRTMNQMDELSKTSQKIGFPVERLSAWAHAADLAGTSVQGMTSGIKAMSRLMDEAAVEGSRGAEIFERLGISVRNADGTMRSVEDTLLDVADRFAAMSDGATKTALAQELLKKGGLEMIPLLNQGAAGIREATAEAERFGLTFSTQAAQAAEQFNDDLSRLGGVVRGIVVQFTAGLTPALASVSGQLVNFNNQNDTAFQLGQKLGDAIARLPQYYLQWGVAMDRAAIAMVRLAEISARITLFDVLGAVKAWNDWGAEVENLTKRTEATVAQMEYMNQALQAEAQYRAGVEEAQGKLNKAKGDGNVVTQEEIAARQELISQGEQYAESLRAEGDAMREAVQGPMEEYRAKLAEIQALQAQGAISADTAARAQVMAAATVANAYASVASNAANALSSLFEDNKAVAIAAAIVNTLEGITAAFKLPFPLNWVQAAAVAASGFAQVRRIRSTRPGSGGGEGANVRGGGGARGRGGGGGGGGDDRAQQLGVNITIVGQGGFTRDQVRSLATQLGELTQDGAVISGVSVG